MKYFNNPLNIRSGSNWLGLRGICNGFCEFTSVEYCLRAGLVLLLKNYPKHGAKTISQCISRWAPVSDGNYTSLYVKFVCTTVPLSPSDIVSELDIHKLFLLFRAMCWIESTSLISFRVFQSSYKLYKNSI